MKNSGASFPVPFVRSAYNYDMMAVSNETGLLCEDESLAQQHMRDETDINTIVRNFGLTGELPDDIRVPIGGDFTGVTDYKSALDAVIAADDAFMSMPADVRARFHNDAGAFLAFASDEKNIDDLRKMGLTRSPDSAILVSLANDGKQPVKEIANGDDPGKS